jgi:hypothetical protein
MAYVDHPWPDGFWHRYITKESLIRLLEPVPAGGRIFVNDVGNLVIFPGPRPASRTDDVTDQALGYIDIGDETFFPA